jgi:hypothetical protein
MSELFSERIDTWFTEGDAAFIREKARMDGSKPSQAIRSIVRAYRIYMESLQPPQPAAKANGRHPQQPHA